MRSSRSQPSADEGPIASLAPGAEPSEAWCDLCGANCHEGDFHDAAGLFVCNACLEDALCP
jgi:hypothetical protein